MFAAQDLFDVVAVVEGKRRDLLPCAFIECFCGHHELNHLAGAGSASKVFFLFSKRVYRAEMTPLVFVNQEMLQLLKLITASFVIISIGDHELGFRAATGDGKHLGMINEQVLKGIFVKPSVTRFIVQLRFERKVAFARDNVIWHIMYAHFCPALVHL